MRGNLTPADLAELETLALAQHEIRQCMEMARQSALYHLPHREAYWNRRADLAALAWAAVDRAIREQHRDHPVQLPGQTVIDVTGGHA